MYINIARCALFGLSTILWTEVACADTEITLTPVKTGAIYHLGEKIVWRASVTGDNASSILQAAYVLKKGGATVVGQGTVDFNDGTGTIGTALNNPGTILAEVIATNSNHQILKGFGGAAIAPDKIPPSAVCPDDFDAFWKAKLEELAAVPKHPVLGSSVSGVTNVNYWKIRLNNIRGTHIYGQLARPVQGDKFPALLIVQHAGVYPLNKSTVIGHAADGWLTLNISAHDLPIDEPPAFYQELSTNELKNYTAIGSDDREHSYFLRMFLACYRAVDYLSDRPDWDGKTLVVMGGSQGGLQSFVAAGLNPKVTTLTALIPAGCDNTGDLVGRKPGWPWWQASANSTNEAQVRQTSRYFDAVNFAARVKCPALVGLGLIDTTSPPSGVFAAINQLQGTKEVVVLPNAEHMEHNHSQAPYYIRQNVWLKALLNGQPIPSK